MNSSFSNHSFGFLAFVAILWGFLVTIFWMVIAWRAMRAHERIVDALSDPARRERGDSQTHLPHP